MVGMFSEIEDEFFRYMGDIVYATMTTVGVKDYLCGRLMIVV